MDKIITCAFCKGTGKDPFNLLSSLSHCQVCKGTCRVEMKEPFKKCVYCSGSGKNNLGARVPCIVCGGKGDNYCRSNTKCSQCKGTGKAIDRLPCTGCRGKGYVI